MYTIHNNEQELKDLRARLKTCDLDEYDSINSSLGGVSSYVLHDDILVYEGNYIDCINFTLAHENERE